ncbi:MAG: hypothetical protein NWR42_03810, partial [Desulfobacterales bacterium]|nr:hypothetical protein [Desulfobacterales bacterium]
LDMGVWMAKLEPDEVATLGKCENRSGPFSVLLLDSEVDYDEKTQTLTFNPNATCLLNIGGTEQILVLSSKDKKPVSKPAAAPSAPVKAPTSKSSEPSGEKASTEEPPEEMTADTEISKRLATGDKLFLSELPADMRGLGETLLSGIRGVIPGELNFEPRSAKFDETPEIFWTIKILPSKKALRLTVRGTPETFEQTSGIDLKLDKFGYSAFHITRVAQVPGAITLLKQARKNME